MNNSDQDKLIFNMLYELHQKNLGSLDKLQYPKKTLILYFQNALNQTSEQNTIIKINNYIQKGWIICGMAGYVINPNIFKGVKYR